MNTHTTHFSSHPFTRSSFVTSFFSRWAALAENCRLRSTLRNDRRWEPTFGEHIEAVLVDIERVENNERDDVERRDT